MAVAPKRKLQGVHPCSPPLSPRLAQAKALGALVRPLVPFSLGLLLLTAAALKGYELFAAPLPEASVWSSRAFRIVAVEAEGFLSLWLLSGRWRRGARWTALFAFGVFFAVSLSKAQGGEASCGCFGRVSISPRWSAGLDLAAIIALWLWQPAESAGWTGEARWPRGAAVVLLMWLIGGAGGMLLAVNWPAGIDASVDIDVNQSVVLLEPEKWVGRRCPFLPYTDIGEDLSQGKWLVVLYHHDCERCQAVVPVFEAMARSAGSDPAEPRIAFVAVPPYGPPLWQFDPRSSSRQGRLDESKNWFVGTPTVLRLQDGVVQPKGSG
jgi:hypothetical protein